VIAAILRAQWRSMRLGSSRSAVFGLITGCVWYGFWSSVSYAAYAVARSAGISTVQTATPVALLLILLYWQVVPVISGSLGSALDMRKLLVYPAPHGKLFVVEVLLRLTTGAEMVLVLAGGSMGLLGNPAIGSWAAAPRLLAGDAVYILFNLLLASGLRSVLERLLARRHVREVLVFLMLAVATVPRLLLVTNVRPESPGWLSGPIRAAALPWAAAGNVLLGQTAMTGFLLLSAWTVLAAWFGRTQFERNLRYDALAAQATPLHERPVSPVPWSERFYRLPGAFFADPLAALIEKELRSLSRTPRFRMVFVMGFSFGLVMWLPLIIGREANRSGEFGRNFLVVVSMYALTLLGQVTYWNCFGFDRSAVALYFGAPQSIRRVLLGKNIASMVFVYLEVVILIGLTLVMRLGGGPGKAFETLIVVSIGALYMLAFGNISSIEYPRALKPERVSQGGASSRVQGLVFLLYPLALLPVFLAYLARYAFDSQIIFAVILSFAGAVGGILYWIAMDSAVNAATRHRERLLRELSRGEGPVASG